jgi:hypothetical protein
METLPVRESTRPLEFIGTALLVVVLVVVGSRVSADGDAAGVGVSSGDGSSDIAGLVDRLRMAGLTVSIQGEAHEDQLSVTGRSLMVDGEMVEVFAYADIWSAEAASAKLVTAKNDAVDEVRDWIDAPHPFRNDRLLVIHVGGSSQLNAVLNGVLSSSSNIRNAR